MIAKISFFACALALSLLPSCTGGAASSVLQGEAQASPQQETLTPEQREAKLREQLLQLAERVGEEGIRLYFVFSHDAEARNSEYEYGTARAGLSLIKEPIGTLSADDLRALARAERTPDSFEQLTPDFALDWELPKGFSELCISTTRNARYGITIRSREVGALYLNHPELHARIIAMLQDYHRGKGRQLDKYGMPINEPQRRALVELIASLPDNSVYEETPAEFRQRLEEGEFSHFAEDIYSLSIGGDGCYGRRVFMLYVRGDKDELQMVMTSPSEEEEGVDIEAFYNYNPESRQMEFNHSVRKQATR